MSEFEPNITIPDKCLGCGVQHKLGSALFALLLMKHRANETGESLVGESGERFDAMVEARVPEELADKAKQSIPKSVGEVIEDLDGQIEATQSEINANALSCSGVFKMRATKGEVNYTASICTSEQAYVRDGYPSLLPTYIKAESVLWFVRFPHNI